MDLTDRIHDILYFTFGDIGGSFNRNDRQDAAGNQRCRSYDTGWIGDLPATVSSAAGTGIAGDGYNLAVFKCNGKRAAQRAADADQIFFFHNKSALLFCNTNCDGLCVGGNCRFFQDDLLHFAGRELLLFLAQQTGIACCYSQDCVCENAADAETNQKRVLHMGQPNGLRNRVADAA